jgi:mannose-6-phosphate isomerase-like protein (cupin superfamily)
MAAVINRDSASHYQWGEHCDGWHLLRSQELSVIEERMPPGTAEVKHYHQRAQQLFYVLSGAATFEIDGRRLRVRARESLHIDAGTEHNVANLDSSDLEFLVISCPPSHGDRLVVNRGQEVTSPSGEALG